MYIYFFSLNEDTGSPVLNYNSCKISQVASIYSNRDHYCRNYNIYCKVVVLRDCHVKHTNIAFTVFG